MSLKKFHIIFLIISSLFSMFFCYWCFREWGLSEDNQYLIYLSIGIILWLSLLIYGKWFLKEISSLNAK